MKNSVPDPSLLHFFKMGNSNQKPKNEEIKVSKESFDKIMGDVQVILDLDNFEIGICMYLH